MTRLFAQQGQEGLGLKPVLQREADGQRPSFVEARAPVVVGDGLQQIRIVGDQLGIEQRAALEGAIPEGALAEAVDGKDGRLVETAQRAVEPGEHLPRLRQVRRDEPRHHVVAAASGAKGGGGIGQRLADAVAQFLGGRLGERDDEDFAHGEIAFQNQPEKQPGDGEGLARAGAGLDERGARGQRRRGELEGRRRRHGSWPHASSRRSCCRMGSKTRRASAMNSSSSGSASRKQSAK